MAPIFQFIFLNGWVVFIVFTVLNAFMLKARSQKTIARKPDLRAGYEQLFRGYLVYMNIPWLVMGFGMLVGKLPNIFSFFTPRQGNLFVLAFHASIVILWILSVRWIYFKGGAEFIVRHPGALNAEINSPLQIKLLFGVMLLGGILGMGFMWAMNFPGITF